MSQKRIVKFEIYRYDPDKDERPYMQKLEVELQPTDKMLLDALIRIKNDVDDSLALRLSQPLRIESGGLSLNLPVDYSYATLSPVMGLRRLSLSPHGRELDAELMWRGALWNGAASASLFWRKDPGHYATLPDDRGVAISWNRQF